jgi:hypothetical protein
MKAGQALRISIASFAVVAGLGLGSFGYGTIANADKMLADNVYFQRQLECINLKKAVDTAENELGYTGAYTTFFPLFVGKIIVMMPIVHPANHPDPLYSIQALDNAITDYGSTQQNQRDMPGLDTRLGEIKGTLPAETGLKQYNGSPVDNSTFQSQRTALKQESDTIASVIANYGSRVPSGLKNARTYGASELAGGIVLGVGSLAVMVGVNEDFEYIKR